MDSIQLNELFLKMNGLERAVYGLNKLKSNILAKLLKYYYLTRYFSLWIRKRNNRDWFRPRSNYYSSKFEKKIQVFWLYRAFKWKQRMVVIF